jgi:3-methylcrotonyl-CoA carboxylase alpha subunit
VSARRLHTKYRIAGTSTPIDVLLEGDRVVGTVDGKPVEARVRRVGANGVVVHMEGASRWATVVRDGSRLLVAVDGESYVLEAVDPAEAAAPDASVEPFAVSPMTGTVAKVAVAPGATVAKGAALFVVEAMKMEYVVKAPRDVTVGEVKRKAGDRVALGDVVVTFREGS